MSDGKRVNFRNISYYKTKKLDVDNYQLTFYWRYKASIKNVDTVLYGKDLDLYKFFEKYNTVQLTDGIFINLSKILYTEEEKIFGPTDKVKLTILFEDGQRLEKILKYATWSWWRDRYM